MISEGPGWGELITYSNRIYTFQRTSVPIDTYFSHLLFLFLDIPVFLFLVLLSSRQATILLLPVQNLWHNPSSDSYLSKKPHRSVIRVSWRQVSVPPVPFSQVTLPCHVHLICLLNTLPCHVLLAVCQACSDGWQERETRGRERGKKGESEGKEGGREWGKEGGSEGNREGLEETEKVWGLGGEIR